MSRPLDIRTATLLIDADSIVFGAGFAAEKNSYTVRFGPEYDGQRCLSAHFQYKAEVKKFLEEAELGEGEYELETQRQLEPLRNALSNTRTQVRSILDKLGCKNHELWLTGKGNFRYDIATIQPYKGNRENTPRPTYEPDIREYLVRRWGAQITDGQEADDAVTIRRFELDNPVIVSADKDLDMVPGWHSKIKNPELYYVTEEEGLKNFYRQLVTGDYSDHIRGIPGRGIVYANKILSKAEEALMFSSLEELDKAFFLAVFQAYVDYHFDCLEKAKLLDTVTTGAIYVRAWDELVETGQLLWMRRKPEEMWHPPLELEEIPVAAKEEGKE